MSIGLPLLLSLVATVAILHSVIFVWRYYTPQAFFDLWFWVGDYERWLNGSYTLHDLIKAHYGEHRIVTTRLLLLLDSVLFQMRGVVEPAVNVVALALTGLIVWGLGRRDGGACALAALPPLFWIALMLATCQVENLIFPFQVQFSLTCLAAAAAAAALAKATDAAQARPTLWALASGALALLADASMASGILLAPGLIAMLALRRGRAAAWFGCAPLALAGAALFLAHHQTEGAPSPLDIHFAGWRFLYIGGFLGSFLTAPPVRAVAPWVGFAGLVLFAAFGARLLHRFTLRRRPLPGGDAALLALGIFVALCGPAGSLTPRITIGWEAALVARYATMSLLFVAVLLALAARAAGRHALPPIAAGILLAVVNLPAFSELGAGWHHAVRADMIFIRNNIGIEGPVPIIFFGRVDDVRNEIGFLHAHHLNIFALGTDPHPVVPADTARLPLCRGYIDDAAAIDSGAFLIRGWLADSAGSRTASWIAARDADGRLLGVSPVLDFRADVQAALGTVTPARGLATGFRLPDNTQFGADPREIYLLGLFPDGTACALSTPARIAPILFPPFEALRDSTPTGAVAQNQGFATWHSPPGFSKPPQAAGMAWEAPADGRRHRLRFTVVPPPPGRALVLPFAMPGSGDSASVTFYFRDGSALTSSIPSIWDRLVWRAAVLPVALTSAHGGTLGAEIDTNGMTPLRAGPPLAAELPADWSKLF